MPDLRLDSVEHVYRKSGVRALAGVDLRIGSGERLAIVGQNGSGKSTLVRHLNGLLRPTAGRLVIDGMDAAALRVARLARIVGVAFQDPDRQIFAGTVRGEVEFGARNVGMSSTALREATAAALDVTGLTGDVDRNPYELGHGRRRLLTIASVLAMRTPVVVLDEPTTGLDLAGTRRVRQIVERLHAEGRTVIAVTHDMELVADTFDRVVVMRLGQVIVDGTPEDAFAARNEDALRSTNLERPLAARVADRLGLAGAVSGDALVAALRARTRGAAQ